MSLAMTKRVWADKSLTNMADRLVMLALADAHNPQFGCFPSLQSLEQKTQLSNPGLLGIIDRLIKGGHVKKIRGGGRGHSNNYVLYPEREPDLSPKTPNAVSPLSKPKHLTPGGETPNAMGYKHLTPCEKTPNAVSSFSLEKTQNSDLPNGNRNGNKNGNTCADALSLFSDSEPQKKPENPPQTKTKAFAPPTQDEMKAYFGTLGLPESEINGFFDHHSARGWFLGKGVKMKDWRAAARTWRSNYHRFNGNSVSKAGTNARRRQDHYEIIS
jgi:hypothetical protein